MRYVGLMFVGLVLWVGQASAARIIDRQVALEIITEGKTIGESYSTLEAFDQQVNYRTSRVVYQGRLFICHDWLIAPDDANNKQNVSYTCYDDQYVE